MPLVTVGRCQQSPDDQIGREHALCTQWRLPGEAGEAGAKGMEGGTPSLTVSVSAVMGAVYLKAELLRHKGFMRAQKAAVQSPAICALSLCLFFLFPKCLARTSMTLL